MMVEIVTATGIKVFKEIEGDLNLIYSESAGLNEYSNPKYENQNIVESEADFNGDGYDDIIYSTLNISEPVVTVFLMVCNLQ